RRLVRTKINGRADGNRAHVVCFLDSPEEHLVKPVRQRQQLVVIDLHDEGNLVRVLARDGTQHSKSGRDSVAAAFDRELDNVFRVEVFGVGSKRSAGRMFDALVYGQDRNVTSAREAAVVEETLQGTKYARRPVGNAPHTVHEVWAGQVQVVFSDR